VQKVVPLLLGVTTHCGEDRRRLGEHGRNLLAQRLDFRRELVDDRANVVGDLLDLVFVLISQKLPHFFQPRHRVTDPGQQIQDRGVDRVDFGRIGTELSRD
jgi:hypothetical protein